MSRPIETPRPSRNFGKLTSTRVACASSPATAAGASAGSRRITFTSGDGGFAVTTRRSLISVAIDLFFERFDSDAMHHVNEALGLAVAAFEVALDQPLDHVGRLRAREGWPDHLAQGSLRAGANFALVTADLDLVPLLAVLIDAEDADMPDVVMAAGVHAAGNVEIELADVVQLVEIVEAPLDCFRHRNRLGVGQRAEIAAGAGDDIGEQPQVGRRKPEPPRLAPHLDEIALSHVGEHQVLFVRDAQLAERVAVGELG